MKQHSRTHQLLFQLASALTLLTTTLCEDKEAWRSKTIYQIVTDRFWRSDDSTAPCKDIYTYCGGSYKGIQKHLDYIQGMGFDAIWVSPIIKNTPGGYHGYWMMDLYKLNLNFGSVQDFKDLVAALHKRGMWMMIDVVGNHMGYVPNGTDFSMMVPFNKGEYYHKYCPINPPDYAFNQYVQEHCWLSGLPDLNQSVPFVYNTLVSWIGDLVRNYSIDGIRIDTVGLVEKPFWTDFTKSSGVYSVGEVYDQRTGFSGLYQGPVDGVLNYPLYFTLIDVYCRGRPLYQLRSRLQAIDDAFPDPALNGIFLDNHDNPRFLNRSLDIGLLKNALSWLMFAQGIPIVYYGTEQGFHGGPDPHCREPLWTSLNPEAEMYKFIAQINKYRKKLKITEGKYTERFVSDEFYAFSRGNVYVATTNVINQNGQFKATYHPFVDGSEICNIYDNDCITIENGVFLVEFRNGVPKVFIPKEMI